MNTMTEERTDAPTAEVEGIIARLKKNAKNAFTSTVAGIKKAFRWLLNKLRAVKAKFTGEKKTKAASEKSRFMRHGKKNIANTVKWVARVAELVTFSVLAVFLAVSVLVAIAHDTIAQVEHRAASKEADLKDEAEQAKAERAEKKAAKKSEKAAKKAAKQPKEAPTAEEVRLVVDGEERSEEIQIVTAELLEEQLMDLGKNLERKYAAAHSGDDTNEASYLFGQLASFYIWQEFFVKREDFSPLKAYEETMAEAKKHGYSIAAVERGYEYGEVIAKLAESLDITESVYSL